MTREARRALAQAHGNCITRSLAVCVGLGGVTSMYIHLFEDEVNGQYLLRFHFSYGSPGV